MEGRDATNPSLFQADRVTNPDNHPVEGVTWQDTQAFVKALNAKEKTHDVSPSH